MKNKSLNILVSCVFKIYGTIMQEKIKDEKTFILQLIDKTNMKKLYSGKRSESKPTKS